MNAITNTWTTVRLAASAAIRLLPALAPLAAKTAVIALAAIKWGMAACMFAPIIVVPTLFLISTGSEDSATPSLMDRTLQIFYSTILGGEVEPTIDTTRYPLIEGPVVPRPARITAGCTNVGNSCWLNASFNLMAGTAHFDDLLNISFPTARSGEPEETRKLRELVPFLKIAVNNLRTGKSVDSTLARIILSKIGNARYVLSQNNTINMSAQHDPADFIRGLTEDWYTYSQFQDSNCPAPHRPNILTEYEPIGDHGRSKASVCRAESIVDVGILPIMSHDHVNNADILDQNACIDLDSVIRSTQEQLFELDGQGITERAEFRRIDYFDNNNRRAIINVKRIPDSNIRLRNPINISPDCTITLGGEPYRVQGSLIHQGGAHGGHWFYVEVNQTDGKFYNHNDSSVYEVASLNENRAEGGIHALRQGTIFFVEKIAVSSEN